MRQQPRERERRQRLAAARLADDADEVSAVEREAHVVDGHELPGVGLERHREVLDRRSTSSPSGSAARGSARRTRGLRAAETLAPGAWNASAIASPSIANVTPAMVMAARGRQGDDRSRVELVEALGEHAAPVEVGRLDAEAEEAERRQRDQREADRHGRLDDQRLRDVGQDVAGDDPPPADADRARGRDVVGRHDLHRQRLRHARERRHGRDRDREHRLDAAWAEHGRDEQRDDQRGERDRPVDDVHQRGAQRAARDRRGRAHQAPEHGRDRRARDREHEREPRRHERPCEHVAAEVVRSEPVRGGRRLPRVRRVELGRLRAPDHRREDREEEQQREHRQRHRAGAGARDALERSQGPHASRSPERGSRIARTTSRSVLRTSTIVPRIRIEPWMTG